MSSVYRRVILLSFFMILSALCMRAQNWDINMLHHINSWDSEFFHHYSSFVSATEPYVAVGVPAAMAVVGIVRHDKALVRDAVYVGSSVVGAFALTYGLKYIVGRDRPYVAYPDLISPHSYEDSPSFPSGHTASAFALATSLCVRYPKWYVIAPSAAYAVSVGMSRMYEGVHYPTDVMAGAAIGAGSAVASIYLSRWLNKVLLGN